MTRALTALALSALPAAAWACPVCFDPTAQNQTAYLASTIFMSLLPLALIGGGLWWVWAQTRGGV